MCLFHITKVKKTKVKSPKPLKNISKTKKPVPLVSPYVHKTKVKKKKSSLSPEQNGLLSNAKKS